MINLQRAILQESELKFSTGLMKSGKYLDLIQEATSSPSTTPPVSPHFTSLNLEKLATDLSHLPSHYIPPKKWEHLVKLIELSAELTLTTKLLPQLPSVTTSHIPAETPYQPSSTNQEDSGQEQQKTCCILLCEWS